MRKTIDKIWVGKVCYFLKKKIKLNVNIMLVI